MANSSDIIKIGFDYRSSLAQFEKETNGVFDGISEKAGKQKIVIQLDAKNDKVIEKIKELQKLKLDKFTFEFGDSGIKEQLKTFGQLENKIIEIMNLSKGIGGNQTPIIDLKDSTSQINKLQNKLDELDKRLNTLSKKNISTPISDKDIDLINNEEFKKLSIEVETLKTELKDLNSTFGLLRDGTVDVQSFIELSENVTLLTDKIEKLDSVIKTLDVSKINSIENKTNNIQSSAHSSSTSIKEESKALEQISESAKSAINSKEQFSKVNKAVKTSADNSANSIKENTKATEQETKATQKLAEKKRKLRQQEKQSAQSSVDKALTDQISAWKQIQSIREQILKSDNQKEITLLQESKKYYQEQYLSAQRILKSNSDLYNKESQLAKLEQIRLETSIKLERSAGKKNQSYIDSVSSNINSFQTKVDDYSKRANQSAEYREQVEKLKDAIQELTTEQAKLFNTEGINKEQETRIEDLTNSCKEYISTIQHMSAAEKGSSISSRMKEYDKISEYMKKNTRMSKEFREELEELKRLLISDDASVNVDNINTRFIKVKDKIRSAKQEGQSFIDIFKNKVLYGFASKLAMYYLSFYDFIRYTRNAVNAVVELDTALVDLKKTTTMTNAQLEDFYYSSNDTAKQMGVTTQEIIDQASAWSRLNKIGLLYGDI